MVVFTCNNCGETLQKPRVAKHYQFQCRSAAFLTCVDCFKDFRGDEYVAHTKCITEAERYGGKDYVPKPGLNKGERKQQEWLNIVNKVLGNATDLSNAEHGFLTNLSKFDNIPRKKAKFLNFVRSALGNKTNMAVVEAVWAKMESAYKSSSQKATEDQQVDNDHVKGKEANGNENGNESSSKEHQENNIAENQNNENICRESNGEDQQNVNNDSCIMNGVNEGHRTKKSKKSKKRVISEAEEQNEEPASKKKSKTSSVLLESSVNQYNDTLQKLSFDWKSTILNIVQSKGEVSLKKLQKKVISQYMNHCTDTVTHEKAVSKFNKKLKKVSEVIISDDRVKLA